MSKYVIIGGGPTGIALAWNLAPDHEVVLVESGTNLGGCHAPSRKSAPDGYTMFAEHGPRIYSSSFRQFQALLSDMGIDHDWIFQRYKSSMGDAPFTTVEMSILIGSYLTYSLGLDYQNEPLMEYLTRHNFTGPSINYLSRLVLLVDGIDITKFSVQGLFNLINYEGMSTFYTPKVANDKRLFAAMEAALVKRGVVIVKSSLCTQMLSRDGVVYAVNTVDMKNGKPHGQGIMITADKVLLAVPPQAAMKIPLINIGSKTRPTSGLGSGYKSRDSSVTAESELYYSGEIENPLGIQLVGEYMDYHSTTFMWKSKLDAPMASGDTSHGLIHQWSNFAPGTEDYQTIISCGLTLPDAPNKYERKLDQLSQREMIGLVWDNLKQLYPDLPLYDQAAFGPKHDAVSRAAVGFKPHRKPLFTLEKQVENVDLVGPHTSVGNYGFTSIESAVAAANEYCRVSAVWFYYSINMVVLFLVIIVIALIAAYKYTRPVEIVYV